jgi:flagellar protein FliS
MQPGSASIRNAYVTGGLATASPAKILELAFERLDRDLATALEAIGRKEIERCHAALCHAQDLVIELHMMLDKDAWEHADALSSIYVYVLEVLTRANVKKSAVDVRHARALLAEIGGAFSVASSKLQQGHRQPPAAVEPPAPTNGRPTLSLRA